MLLNHVHAPTRATFNALSSLSSLSSSLPVPLPRLPTHHGHNPACSAGLALILPHIFVRPATHKAERAANSKKNGPGKRLGVKKGSGEYVIPGNILLRQRGTRWHAGENVFQGRDHTLHAAQPGYVRFYRDPRRHPKRRYIGVALARDDVLPAPPNQPRRRRLGMVAVPREVEGAQDEHGRPVADAGSGVRGAARAAPTGGSRRRIASLMRAGSDGATGSSAGMSTSTSTYPPLKPGYQYRVSNWEIGRAAERAGVKVRPFVKGDRFRAWRKKTARMARNAERRGMTGGKGKGKGGKAKKGGKGRGR